MNKIILFITLIFALPMHASDQNFLMGPIIARPSKSNSLSHIIANKNSGFSLEQYETWYSENNDGYLPENDEYDIQVNNEDAQPQNANKRSFLGGIFNYFSAEPNFKNRLENIIQGLKNAYPAEYANYSSEAENRGIPPVKDMNSKNKGKYTPLDEEKKLNYIWLSLQNKKASRKRLLLQKTLLDVPAELTTAFTNNYISCSNSTDNVQKVIHSLPNLDSKATELSSDERKDTKTLIDSFPNFIENMFQPTVEHVNVGQQSGSGGATCGPHSIKNTICLLSGVHGLRICDLKREGDSPLFNIAENFNNTSVETLHLLFPNIKAFNTESLKVLFPFDKTADLLSLKLIDFKRKLKKLNIATLIQKIETEQINDNEKNILKANLRTIRSRGEPLTTNELIESIRTIQHGNLVTQLGTINKDNLNLSWLEYSQMQALADVVGLNKKDYLLIHSLSDFVQNFTVSRYDDRQFAGFCKFLLNTRDKVPSKFAFIVGNMIEGDPNERGHWRTIVASSDDRGKVTLKCADSLGRTDESTINYIKSLLEKNPCELHEEHMKYLFEHRIPTPDQYERMEEDAVSDVIRNFEDIVQDSNLCNYNTTPQFHHYATNMLKCLNDMAYLDKSFTPLLPQYVERIQRICDFATATATTQNSLFTIKDEYPDLYDLLNPKDSASSSDDTASTDSDPSN